MSALVINGITIPTLDNSSRDIVNLGGVERAESGKVRSFERGTYYEHRFTTPPLTMADAVLYKALIRGDGHTLSFESTFTTTSYLWTSRGIPPSFADGESKTSPGVHGAYALEIVGAGESTWGLGLTGGWTVAMFQRASGVGAWAHTIVRSEGYVYNNGVEVPGTTTQPFILVLDGSVSLRGSPLDWMFDDVVVLPYAVPDVWCPLIYAHHSAQAWSPLKYVYASGARISGTKKMMGVIESVTDVEFGDETGHHQGEQVTFLLKESP